MEERYSLLFYRTCWAGCLLGFAGTGYFLFGLAGYVQNPILNLCMAAAFLVVVVFFFGHFFAMRSHAGRIGGAIWAAILVILVVEVLLGAMPPTSRDELTHHLAIPALRPSRTHHRSSHGAVCLLSDAFGYAIHAVGLLGL